METGLVRGRHYSTYPDDVKALLASGDTEAAIRLLLELVDATENESRLEGFGVAPWYYEKLAIVYRKQGRPDLELEILQRFELQQHAPGGKPAKLLERLEKIRR